MIALSKLPPEAADVLRVIRRWQRVGRSGCTRLDLRCVAKGHPEATDRGLDYLKKHRLVEWDDEGRSTRYRVAKTKAKAAA